MTTAVRLVRSRNLTDAAEYAYAAVVAADSQLVFCAGACPLDSGLTVGIGDVRTHAAQAMLNLSTSLADSDASLSDVIRTTVYVASSDREDLVAAWGVVRDALAPHDPPSTLLGVAALGYADQLVEVDAVAAIKTDP
jgi:enamine deaminase RidA (YjgF/YER057c/UK114 family)